MLGDGEFEKRRRHKELMEETGGLSVDAYLKIGKFVFDVLIEKKDGHTLVKRSVRADYPHEAIQKVILEKKLDESDYILEDCRAKNLEDGKVFTFPNAH